MKLFISSDIEGTCGINHWDETEIGKPGYDRFAREMTREVRAACDGALSSGYFQNAETDEIRIKDAHDSARNIIPEELPESEMIRLIRGWVTIPGNMMAGVKGCDAAAMTGYHSGAYSAGNNLSHTSNLHNQVIEVNGRRTSEFDLNAMFAAYYGVPTIGGKGADSGADRGAGERGVGQCHGQPPAGDRTAANPGEDAGGVGTIPARPEVLPHDTAGAVPCGD